MKIVTAGHRGSVATGDGIMGARDNRRRVFSYSLIILFSICGDAVAAKLCQAKCPLAAPASSEYVSHSVLSAANAGQNMADPTWSVNLTNGRIIKGVHYCVEPKTCYCRVISFNNDARCGKSWVEKWNENCDDCAYECGWAFSQLNYYSNGWVKRILE